MKKYQIAVIGGGVIGSEIARYLTAKSLSVCLLEKDCDIANFGATKANSGIVHAGFDCQVGSLKAKMNVRGSELYEKLCQRLSVEYLNCGALVVGREQDLPKLEALYKQGIENNVKGLSIIERKEIEKRAKTIHPDIKYALLAQTSAVISPYLTAIAMAEEAKLNGCDFFFDSEVKAIFKTDGGYILKSENVEVFAELVINAAGANSADINELFGEKKHPLRFARGEYLLLDLNQKGFVSSTIFPLPTELGKGVLCSPTAHGNIIVGPTAIDTCREDYIVSSEGLDYIKKSIGVMIEGVDTRKNIRVFSGNRAISGEDFVIEKSKLAENYIYLIGICSPGLSSAPAISEYVANLVESCGFKLKDKENIIFRKPYTETQKLTAEQLNALIKSDKAYGKIVCRCEKITEGEIVEAIKSPLMPTTVDGIKRRVRAGMGRCQGGFCMPSVMELIAKYANIDIEKVSKFGKGSEILFPSEGEKQ